MIVVNLFGSPGSSKSTLAAYIFSQLKMHNINCELVTEFAKDKVWEESKAVFENQVYIFGKQFFRLTRINNKVDVAITDSPILLSSYYNSDLNLEPELTNLVFKSFEFFNNYSVFLYRVKPYNPIGRFQSEDESNEIANDQLNFLKEHGINFNYMPGNIDTGDFIVKEILKILE